MAAPLRLLSHLYCSLLHNRGSFFLQLPKLCVDLIECRLRGTRRFLGIGLQNTSQLLIALDQLVELIQESCLGFVLLSEPLCLGCRSEETRSLEGFGWRVTFTRPLQVEAVDHFESRFGRSRLRDYHVISPCCLRDLRRRRCWCSCARRIRDGCRCI